jgi:threonine dehydrogenase-like Zn-dependent dehydrogenase
MRDASICISWPWKEGVGKAAEAGDPGANGRDLWDRDISITTRPVDTVSTPMPLNSPRSHKIDPKPPITHRFRLDHILEAYETFGHAADTRALKVIIEAC